MIRIVGYRRPAASVSRLESRAETGLESAFDSEHNILLTTIAATCQRRGMHTGPLVRGLGIAALATGLLGLLVLGGAGWSLEAIPAADSGDANELVVLEGGDYDLGAAYRDAGPSAAPDAEATDRAATAGLSAVASEVGSTLVAPADRSEERRFGGLLYAHAISAVGAALVAGRALVGWRLDIRRLSLEPTGRLPVGGDAGSEPADRQSTTRVARSGE
ncbi:hypothetical protein C477_21310 [Haloterrigena salina JCM 13891]|uniref:Uncharacterized protein n=2 Tax=Haloterrigena salina TaxID=504937 RepID=M0BSE8_9EURY|nr:hypothetical protein C477_21310 [Haloterrigena salina JCM 13891]